MKYITRFVASLFVAAGMLYAPVADTKAVASEMTATHDRTGNVWARLRGIGILPDADSSVTVGGVAAPLAGVDVDDAFTADLDFTYFLTHNIALELVLALSKHDVDGAGSLAGTPVGDFYLIPPHLMIQYHFDMGSGIKPYVGAGINYSIIFSEDDAPGFSGLSIDNGIGFSLQAGVDVDLNDKWFLNLDVKKTWLNVDAKTNLGAVPVTADIDVDPWIVGVGIGYRF